jgi:D-arabinose 1-dehydrogenase-like Zn-dependent alcohol dehydrogenase
MTQRIRMTATGFDTPLVVEDAPWPATGPVPSSPEHVVVAVEACGVCHRDLIDRSGRFPYLSLPVTPGHEAAGRVVAVGEDVKDFAVGDRVATLHRNACGACEVCLRGDTCYCSTAAWVFGLIADGGYADHVEGPESAFYRVPDTLDAGSAATLHCTFGTSWRSLVTVGQVQAGESVLVTGANGGVGLAGVQIAARAGARVTAVVRRPGFEDALERAGAARVVVDPDAKFHRTLHGFDLAYECVGAATFAASLRCVKQGGRLVVVGNIEDARVPLNLGQLIVFGQRIIGPGGATRRDMEALLAAHAERPFDFPETLTLPLAEAEAAHTRLRQGGLVGRMVLKP